MLKGSNRKERMTKTKNSTGKKARCVFKPGWPMGPLRTSLAPDQAVSNPEGSRGQAEQQKDECEIHESTLNIARKASWGISTDPTCFIRFLPAFCFSRSFRFLLMSPP